MKKTLLLFAMFSVVTVSAQDFVVPDDGDFVSAISAANSRTDKMKRYTILVREGRHISKGTGEMISHVVKNAHGGDSTIWFASPMVTLTAPRVTIIGEGMDRSVVENRPVHEGISITNTLFVDGADSTVVENLTLQCNFNNDPKAFANRAVALRERGCKGNYLKNVRLLSTQDTYYTNAGGTTTLDSCDIHGTVDFICGGGTVRFNNCNIHLVARGKKARNVICAPATKHDEMGYIFKNCSISGDPNQDGRYYLARPWRNEPQCVWLNTRMLLVPDALGYSEMHGNQPRLFAEYGSVDKNGKAIDCSQRRKAFRDVNGELVAIKYSPLLTKEETKNY